MRDHVKILKEYTLLVRARKLDEAQKILRHIWDREESNQDIVKPVKNDIVEVIKPVVLDEDMYSSLDSLTKIKGIGKKTVKDIKVMFKDIKELRKAVKEDKVALRDDIVEKLKEVLK